MARFGQLDARGTRVVLAGEEASVVRKLPLAAFLDGDQVAWFAKLGLLDMAQLLDLPFSTLGARLGPEAPSILALARGVDDEPLVPLAFPREIRVALDWDEGLVGLEPLLFVLRGLSSRVSARLGGRGEAASLLELCLHHDPAFSRHRGTPLETKLTFELSAPIFRDVELERVLRTRLERTTLSAPTLGVTLEVSHLSERAPVQLELGTRGGSRRLQDLPVLLAELETDVGAENLGILSIEDTHAPETRSRLEPIGPRRTKPRPTGSRAATAREQKHAPPDPLSRATRLLGTPAALPGPLRVGESFVLGRSYYTIEKLEFATRLDSISWWTSSAQSRDYVWAWLSGSSGGLQALLFVDRRTKRAYVQGLAD
jgi:protein ImuB